jgi:hypothetical protein
MKRVELCCILKVLNCDDVVAEFILVVPFEQIRKCQVFVLHLVDE